MPSFHPFPKLPLELRLAIWEMTVEPREVEVRIVKPTPEDPLEVQWSHPSQWHYIDSRRCNEAMSDVPTSTRAERKARRKAEQDWPRYRPYVHMVSSTIPGVLHSCREARNHGLYQQISLDVDKKHEDHRYVWLNLEIDLINIGTSFLNYFIPIASFLKRLKLRRANTDEWWSEYEKDLLPSFKNVENIYVVCVDGFWGWGDDDVFNYEWPCPYENLVFIDEHSPMGYLEVGHLDVDRICQKIADGEPFAHDKDF
ncbi:hypothetical protein CC86DRAFT_459947 [Ophiobolus disseminans]|uniref:2EXR domain-containing protein n=1 Tax=Ophiobolus disseminans TaxID=1469910 RepID=A0A6A6ZI35_9PLEO|nr:hypothetical protein CC86DRAFT_459947 [Ophiobolus disseminans]